MVHFQVGATDLTGFVDIQNYSVQQEDVYQEWTDGNYKLRRPVVRTRITGTVPLGFSRAADFSAFLATLAAARDANGYYPVTLYVSNTGATVTTDAFLALKDADKWDTVNGRQWQVQTVTVTEV